MKECVIRMNHQIFEVVHAVTEAKRYAIRQF